MSNIRFIDCRTNRSIDLSVYIQVLCFIVNLKTKVKCNFMAYGCDGTSVVAIWDGLSWNYRKFSLVVFYDYIFNISI